MKLGIMQPYFFPYLGYYSLLKKTDEFILFDTVQFIRHGWIERNRVLKPVAGWQYVGAPLEKKSLATRIFECQTRNDEDWREKIIRQLNHYKKSAPFFRKTMRVVEDSLNIDTTSIVKLNENILRRTCAYLQIPLKMSILSELNLPIEEVAHPGEWALKICTSLGAEEYLNPPGGMEIFDQSQFDAAGIQLRFLKNSLRPYDQQRQTFEAGLSIIDVMMFNDVEQINSLIDDASFENSNLTMTPPVKPGIDNDHQVSSG